MDFPRRNYWWVYWQSESVYWSHHAESGGKALESGTCGLLTEVPAPAGSDVVLCVSGVNIRIHTVEIPARSKRQFLKALPYELEDLLLQEASQYHLLPLLKFKSKSRIPVAVVEVDLMTEWLNACEAQGWTLRALTADFLMLEKPPAQTWLLDVSEQAMLLRRSDEVPGAAIAGSLQASLPAALLLALEHASELPAKIEVRISDDSQREYMPEWERALMSLGLELEVVNDGQSRGARLSSTHLPNSQYNMLSGQFASKSGKSGSKQTWLRPLSIGVLIVLVFCAQWLFEYFEFKEQGAVMQQQLKQTFLQAFPDARNIIDPRFQMQQRMEELQKKRAGSRNNSDLISWLEELAPVLNSATDFSLKSLNYDNNKLKVEFSIPDYRRLESMTEEISAYALSEIVSAERTTEGIHVNLLLRRRQ